MKLEQIEKNKLWKVCFDDSGIAVIDASGNKEEIDVIDHEAFHHGDVIEIEDNGKLLKLHDASNLSALVFITNQCNSNCIMCPDSEKRRMQKNTITPEFLMEYISLLPSDLYHIDVTGGEPTLLKYDLINVLETALRQTENAQIQVLTNGRSFAVSSYANEFHRVVNKRLYFEIPVHAATASLHDLIAGASGAFSQTMLGIDHLIKLSLEVHIRIVVSKLNYRVLNEIIDLIVTKFPAINKINFLGLEVMGNAYHNKDAVWMEFDEIKKWVENAAEYCILKGVEPAIFNYPLCMFDEKYWYCYKKTITGYKVRYFPECDICKVKTECGGFFSSTFHNTQYKVRPVI